MTMTDDIQRFIARWQASGAAERANYQLFLSELCDVLDAPRPDPTTPDEAGNAYVFEKSMPWLGWPVTVEEIAAAFDAAGTGAAPIARGRVVGCVGRAGTGAGGG